MDVKVEMDRDLSGLADLSDLASGVASDDAQAEQRPTVEPTYTFHVRDVVTGKSGAFTSVVPDVKTRVMMARRTAQLAGGQPWESMDFESRSLINALVTCAFCLADKPAWFSDVMAARALHVLLVVSEEVTAHHARWFRGLAGLGEGATYRSLVEVTSGVGSSVRGPEPR